MVSSRLTPAPPMPFDLSSLVPWRDRAGRLSALRLVAFLAVLAPGLVLVGRALLGDLGARPLTEVIHVTGDWATRLLLAAIAVTPLARLLGSAKLVGVRRIIGLATLAYAVVHVVFWAADLGFEAGTMAIEALVRPYLTIGLVAFAGLIAMGVTSSDAMVSRLGTERWKRLHGLVHPIVVLALVHLFLQSKLDLQQGSILTGLAFAGLAVRLAIDRRMALGWGVVVAATLTAFVFAAAAELVWFALKTGRPVDRVLAANLAFAARIAPSWWAAAITFAIAGGALLLSHTRFGRRR